jgi:hypothetical protein
VNVLVHPGVVRRGDGSPVGHPQVVTAVAFADRESAVPQRGWPDENGHALVAVADA